MSFCAVRFRRSLRFVVPSLKNIMGIANGRTLSSPPVSLLVTNDRRRFVVLREAELFRSGMEHHKQYETSNDNADDDQDHGRAGEARSLLGRLNRRLHPGLDAD